MTKEHIVKILNDYSQREYIDTGIERVVCEMYFEEIADKILKIQSMPKKDQESIDRVERSFWAKQMREGGL
ncbi:hypothetical protein SAMN05192529_102118 [Arachidicoccus rhizosphaerae]|uniref:Uncharacterized protein n=1 Tax=Arachidicoccus rhizosphaerae TaxID=551991 RepID=A0A1H3W4U0_9BACT|nr:hypothetical protein [Arachidicoccus rhizosphaerae]SDZ81871.1 hypothetical protein SAMN05192529_102118 [Arachidicoccus rhizosphaerae]